METIPSHQPKPTITFELGFFKQVTSFYENRKSTLKYFWSRTMHHLVNRWQSEPSSNSSCDPNEGVVIKARRGYYIIGISNPIPTTKVQLVTLEKLELSPPTLWVHEDLSTDRDNKSFIVSLIKKRPKTPYVYILTPNDVLKRWDSLWYYCTMFLLLFNSC